VRTAIPKKAKPSVRPAAHRAHYHAKPVHHHKRRIIRSSYPINVAIADCESGARLANGRAIHYSFTLRNNKNPRSTASGKYQFLNGTWRDVTGKPGPASAYSEEEQDAAFWKLWANGAGARNWSESRSCWN
jgi:hypothetical protein